MRFWLGFLVALVSSSAFANGTTNVIGSGNYSCATWNSASRVDDMQTINWIGGYWSGANAMNDSDHQVGNSVGASGVIGEIRLFCQQHPSVTILQAAVAVYNRMALVRR
jgi:hypothetical protein